MQPAATSLCTISSALTASVLTHCQMRMPLPLREGTGEVHDDGSCAVKATSRGPLGARAPVERAGVEGHRAPSEHDLPCRRRRRCGRRRGPCGRMPPPSPSAHDEASVCLGGRAGAEMVDTAGAAPVPGRSSREHGGRGYSDDIVSAEDDRRRQPDDSYGRTGCTVHCGGPAWIAHSSARLLRVAEHQSLADHRRTPQRHATRPRRRRRTAPSSSRTGRRPGCHHHPG